MSRYQTPCNLTDSACFVTFPLSHKLVLNLNFTFSLLPRGSSTPWLSLQSAYTREQLTRKSLGQADSCLDWMTRKQYNWYCKALCFSRTQSCGNVAICRIVTEQTSDFLETSFMGCYDAILAPIQVCRSSILFSQQLHKDCPSGSWLS